MKARIPPKHILSKQQRQACVEYCEQLSEENINRIFKLFCYCLNCDFKFGADRLSRLCHSVEELADKHKSDEIFWEHIDRDLHKVGLNFNDEKYEDIIGNWKKENQIR